MLTDSVTELSKISNQIAHEKGWWDTPRSKAAISLLVQTEISEIIEEYRKNHEVNEVWYEKTYSKEGVEYTTVGEKGDKPCGIPIELADVVIRIADYSAEQGYDLDQALGRLPALENYDSLEEYLVRISWAISMAWNADSHGVLTEDFFLAIAIRYAFRLAYDFNIDIWSAIAEKTGYNQRRPYRHGNKRI